MRIPPVRSLGHGLLLLASVASLAACGRPEQAAVQAKPPPIATEIATTIPLLEPYPAPSPEATAAPPEIPACSFPLTKPTTARTALVDSLDQFSFSEPKVILTGEKFALADWLPDPARVLISQRVNDLDEIAVLNLGTQTTEPIARRPEIGARPFWIDQTSEAVFSDNDPDGTIVLRKGQPGDPASIQTLGTLATPRTAATADGGSMLIFTEQKGVNPRLWQVQSSDTKQAFRAQQVILEPAPATAYVNAPYRATWLPNNRQIAIYGGGALHIFDSANGTACQIDLGYSAEQRPYWIYDASSSPDGKWIALILATGKAIPDYSAYYLLNTQTGSLNLLQMEAKDIVEVAWFPEGRYLIASGVVSKSETTQVPVLGLFLYDTEVEKSKRLLPAFSFDLGGGYGFEASRLLWSPDGRTILAQCTAGREDRICQIEVTVPA